MIFKLASIYDLYEKLQRDGVALDNEVTIERIFNFVATGYFMLEWINNDSSISQEVKTYALIEGIRNDPWLKICGDLATARRHFKLKVSQPTSRLTFSDSKLDSDSFRRGNYRNRKDSQEIILEDGTSFHCHDLVQGVLSGWKNFFSGHPVQMRVIV